METIQNGKKWALSQLCNPPTVQPLYSMSIQLIPPTFSWKCYSINSWLVVLKKGKTICKHLMRWLTLLMKIIFIMFTIHASHFTCDILCLQPHHASTIISPSFCSYNCWLVLSVCSDAHFIVHKEGYPSFAQHFFEESHWTLAFQSNGYSIVSLWRTQHLYTFYQSFVFAR